MSGHCQKCERRWSGNSSHCGNCCHHFSSDQAFDRHLARSDAEEVCHDPATILRKDGETPWFVPVERSHGIVWMKRDDREHPWSGVGAESDSLETSGVA